MTATLRTQHGTYTGPTLALIITREYGPRARLHGSSEGSQIVQPSEHGGLHVLARVIDTDPGPLPDPFTLQDVRDHGLPASATGVRWTFARRTEDQCRTHVLDQVDSREWADSTPGELLERPVQCRTCQLIDQARAEQRAQDERHDVMDALNEIRDTRRRHEQAEQRLRQWSIETVQKAAALGIPETTIAELAGVTRATVRAWLGK